MMEDLLIVILANVGAKPVAVRLDLDPRCPLGCWATTCACARCSST